MATNAPLPKNHMVNSFFGVRDRGAFTSAIQSAINEIASGGVFAGDNLFTFGRNLSFLHDAAFMEAFERHVDNPVEKATIWRIYLLSWAARRALTLNVPGDFVECACYRGTSARILSDYLDFGASGRNYYLYDLFEHDETNAHLRLEAHSSSLYEQVQQRFADLDNVHVTRGKVPEILHEVSPEKIAFMHIDLNNAEAEMGALKLLFDRMSPGAALVLDDYGWLAYRQQKFAEDPFFEALGYQVLELPTGQGLIIK